MKFLGLAFLLLATVVAQETVVPLVGDNGAEVDGHLASHEWDGAESVSLPEGGRLLVKASGGRVWLAIMPAAQHATYVDLFLQTDDGTVHNLHASLQLGERVVAGDQWTDTEPATKWGAPGAWSANRVEYAPGGKEAAEMTRAIFKPYDAHEFWISRGTFAGKTWKLRVEVRDFAGKVADRIFPAGSTRHAPSGWFVLTLE